MSKKLWSVNALASELDRDRRTVTAALAEVSPDGRLKGHPAWFLDTAVRAMSRHGANARDDDPSRSRFLEHFTDRVVNYDDLPKCDTPPRGAIVGFDMAVTVFAGGRPERLLAWLKAGLPYWEEGNFETGEGFKFISHWVIDFQVMLGREIRISGDRRAARILEMTDALP